MLFIMFFAGILVCIHISCSVHAEGLLIITALEGHEMLKEVIRGFSLTHAHLKSFIIEKTSQWIS